MTKEADERGPEVGIRLKESEGLSQIDNVEVSGFDKGIVSEGGEVDISADVVNNKVGLEAQQGTTGTIQRSHFDNNLYDIVYHDDVELQVLKSIASDVVRATNGSLQPIDVAINRRARVVLYSGSEEAARDAFYELARFTWEVLEKGGTIAFGLELLRRALFFLSQSTT